MKQNSVNNNSVNEDQTLPSFVAPNLLAPNSMNIKLCEPNKLCKTNHITVKQAKTLWTNFCGFECQNSGRGCQTLWNQLYETTCNSVKWYSMKQTVTLWNCYCAVCETTSNSVKQTCKKSVKQSDTLSTVQSASVLHITKSEFVTKSGCHGTWPNHDKCMAMELHTWAAVTVMHTVMWVCIVCSLLGMFQAVSANFASPSLDSRPSTFVKWNIYGHFFPRLFLRFFGTNFWKIIFAEIACPNRNIFRSWLSPESSK